MPGCISIEEALRPWMLLPLGWAAFELLVALLLLRSLRGSARAAPGWALRRTALLGSLVSGITAGVLSLAALNRLDYLKINANVLNWERPPQGAFEVAVAIVAEAVSTLRFLTLADVLFGLQVLALVALGLFLHARRRAAAAHVAPQNGGT